MKKGIAALCLLAMLALGCLMLNDDLRISFRERLDYPECPRNPQTGKWYRITPEDAVCADGSKWHGKIRFGDRNKLMIYLLGGGVVLDEHSAAQPYSAAGSKAFYYDNDLGVSAKRLQTGIASDDSSNPFRDWTILLLPYATGDFHVGTEGMHQGYDNFAALMSEIRGRLGDPEQLLITGYSAGGFGAAMLAEDIIAQFAETENITLCVDGALLLHDDWRGIAADRWHAPEHILTRIRSDNLTLDHLLALREKHADVKILFTASTRDGDLAKYQSYIDGGEYRATAAAGEVYFENLCEMLLQMEEALPDAGVYIWNSLPYNGDAGLTKHTILYSDSAFVPLQDGISVADWIISAVEGDVQSHGLNLLQSLQ